MSDSSSVIENPEATTVLLADDHAAIRAGLRMMLEHADGITVVGEASDGDEAVDAAERLRPDVTLMDVRMPGTDGIAATERIVGLGLCPVIVLTTFDLDDYVFGALRAGASGFLVKTASASEIVDAVRAVARGDAVLSPDVTRRVIDAVRDRRTSTGTATAITTPDAPTAPEAPEASPPTGPDLSDLTERERDVARCLGDGLSNAEIATHLYITEATVKTHVSRVLMKLGVASRVQAAIYLRGG